MLRQIIFNGLLLGSCGYAWFRGRTDERIVAAVCIIASFASLALISSFKTLYSNVEYGVLAVDILTLAAFTAVALRSERFWPLWISGLQLTTAITHLLRLIDPTLLPNLAKRREKMLHHIGALKTKANLAQVRKDKTTERQIREALTALLPNGELQERVINVNSFLNKYGPYFIDLIYDDIDPENNEHLMISI